MTDNRNTILAVILSGLVLIAWQYFYNVPQMERQRAQTQTQTELAKPTPQTAPGSTTPRPVRPRPPPRRGQPGAAATRRQPRRRDRRHAPHQDRDAAGDRQHLAQGRAHRRPGADAIPRHRRSQFARDRAVLAFEHGPSLLCGVRLGAAAGSTARLPDRDTVWQQEGSGTLSPSNPVTLKYDNGEGLTFRRTIAIDDRYLFTIKDDVTNVGSAPVTLYPFALISRHGTPEVSGYYILHEGLIGYLGEKGLQEHGYKAVAEAPVLGNGGRGFEFNVTNGWLGITDKYWAAALLPDTSARLKARFLAEPGAKVRYQTDYLQDPQTIAIGGTGSANARLFAGAKEAGVVGINFPFAGHGGYNKQLGLNHFDLLIDWGWFYFITKPMFLALDYFYPPGRQFRPLDSAGDGAGEAAVLPARQQILCLDGEDEIGAAAAGGAEGALSRRPPEAAAGDDGDLPQGEDQPDRRLSSRRAADPGVLLAVQGAVRHHRNAPCAVLWLDQGSLGARPDHDLQPVRAAAFRSDACDRCSAPISRSASGRSSWASRCGSR